METERNLHENENTDKKIDDGPTRVDDMMQTNDASFNLEYTEEGVFLTVDYGKTDGAKLQNEIVLYDINRRNIQGAAIDDLLHRFRRHEERIRIADAQEEPSVDSDVMVFVSDDEMTAEMVLLPPCGSGRKISSGEIKEVLKDKWEIVFGLDDAVIANTAETGIYYKKIIIAHGKPAEKGEDGTINILFNTERSYAPKIDEEGNADYKSLKIFESVTEGETVVLATMPGEGTEGFSVKGTRLDPIRGAEAKLPGGKNVEVSEDGLSLIASKSGRIDYKNGRVEVADEYKISGDVDMTVGNIKFEGDVTVTGGVISGLSVEATGNIEVWGNVEGATLTAGKDIILKKGMQGMDKGKLVSGGNIVAKFLEHGEIEAKGSITSDYIVHCKALAGESIIMKGKWGKIVGGNLSASKEITANTVGSVSNELTVIELGAAPEARARYTELLDEKTRIREQLDKINSVAKVFTARNESSERQEMRRKLIIAQKQLEQQYADTLKEIERLDHIISTDSGARLNVIKSIYPNVKLSIDSGLTTIKNEIKYATFRYSKGEVVFSTCEAK